MDAIAAIAFSMIVVNAIKATGIKHSDKIFKQTVIAGLIAATGFNLYIYFIRIWKSYAYYFRKDERTHC